MPENSNKGGRKPRVTDEDLLDVFRSTNDPVLSTAEVADAVPIKRRGTLNRLQDLEDGHLESKQIGGRNTVWWLGDDLQGDPSTTLDDTDAEHTPTTADGVDTTKTTAGDRNVESGHTRDESDGFDRDDLRDRLAEEVAGSGDLADRRAGAILTMYDHLQEEGAAEKDELLAVVDPDVVEYADRSSVWSNMVKGRDTLRALPGVEKPASGRNKPWRFDL